MTIRPARRAGGASPRTRGAPSPEGRARLKRATKHGSSLSGVSKWVQRLFSEGGGLGDSANGLSYLVPSLEGTGLVLGIYVFFLLFGYLQESIYKIGEAGSTFRFPIFLVFSLCCSNILMSLTILWYQSTPRVWIHALLSRKFFKIDFFILREVALSAVTYSVSMLSTNYALTHVNYPTQVLVKSAKSVPVLLGGATFFGIKYPIYDWISVFVVTTALIVFNFNKTSGPKDITKAGGGSSLGFFFLGLSLFCDSLTGPRQDRLLKRVKLSSTHLMFLTNVFGALLTGAACCFFEGRQPFLFCAAFPICVAYVLLFSLSASFGQLCIFGALTRFGSLHLTLVTTTRKFFTVLLSVAIFRHHMSRIQWICVAAIFAALILQSVCSKRAKKGKKAE